jgi:C4-dicarboxylate transporter, DctM subunit
MAKRRRIAERKRAVSTTGMILLLFAGTFGLAALRAPIGFAMGATSALVLFLMGIPLSTVYVKMAATVDSWPFLAIPFFLLAGNLMTAGGITTRLLNLANVVVGWITGGLSQAVVVVEMILSGMTGSEIGDAAALGSVLLPAMKRSGYAPNYAATIISASATMGPIIPPSIAFVIYGAINDLSIGRLFVAGIVPGVVMGLILMVMQYFLARKHRWPREPRPTVPAAVNAFVAAMPALFMPVLIIGGILGGVFTATEAGALAVPYALVLALFVYREIRVSDLPAILVGTLKDTATIFTIIAVAGAFGYVITVLGVGVATLDFVTGLTKNPWVLLLLLNILFLIIGCFVDVTATMLIFAPLFAKIVTAYGIDPVHFAVVFVLNVSIGMMTPPYGLTMYLMMRIADITMLDFIRAMWPFLTALLIALALITYIPAITLWLPNALLGAR